MHNGRVHLAGGFVAEGERISGPTDQHVSWGVGSQTWTPEPSLPTPRHHPNLISFDGHLLAIGGFESASADAVWITQSGVWKLVGTTWEDAPSLPQPNGESVTCVLGDHLHVCGGRKPQGGSNASWNDHTDIADHFVLTGLDGIWETAAPLPTARNSAASAVIGDSWHVVGGRTVADGNTPVHEVYDVNEDRWRTVAPMPQGQGGLAAVALDQKVYAFGGEYFNDGGGVYPECWVYDPTADAWSALPDMPNPRHGLGAVAIDGKAYVIGGALQVGGNQTSDLVEVFTP
ncbi:MAG: kelch repeat-containing protein [Henriciella sp.]|nr:kelch repeat-containing protein [Henriciella sp.]